MMGAQEISVSSLFENVLLRKLTITNGRQLNLLNIPGRLKAIVQDLLALRTQKAGFAVLAMISVPPNCQQYPCEAQHYA